MKSFAFTRAKSIENAIQSATDTGARFIAGGTNLIDLIKSDVMQPERLIDINPLELRTIRELKGGELSLGALVTNSDTAYDERVRKRFPVLSSAILAGASAQLRNAATNGGNLNQRTRCCYFYDSNSACNKREPKSGCDAIQGLNRMHAILGASPSCIAVYPSDMSVALSVLNANIKVSSVSGERSIPIFDYHRLPGECPQFDNTLQVGELVTSIELPSESFPEHYTYLKVRDRQSYAFALVSVAVVMRLNGGFIETARIALGGVAAKPWRAAGAESLLKGQKPTQEVFDRFALQILAGAYGHGQNNFKIDLSRRAIVRACLQASSGSAQSQSNKTVS